MLHEQMLKLMLTQSSFAGAGTELGNKNCNFQIKCKFLSGKIHTYGEDILKYDDDLKYEDDLKYDDELK